MGGKKEENISFLLFYINCSKIFSRLRVTKALGREFKAYYLFSIHQRFVLHDLRGSSSRLCYWKGLQACENVHICLAVCAVSQPIAFEWWSSA